MKKIIVGAFISIAIVMISGCGEKDKYDGNYTCEIEQSFNNSAIDKNLKFVFNKGEKTANVSVNNKVITIHGMPGGDYKTETATEIKDPKDGDILTYKGSELEVVFYRDHNEFRFAPYDGGLQILENCK